MNEYLNKIIYGDNVDVMRQLPDESIDLIVTSPPYDNLRDYKGYEWDFGAVVAELKRTMKPGAVAVWVINDSTEKGSETGNSFRQALHFIEAGFNLHDTMIYEKNKAHVYDPRHHRYKQQFEYMFVFSKGKPKTFNPIENVPVKNAGQTRRVSQRLPDGRIRKDRVVTLGDYQARGNVWRYDTGIEDRIAYEHPAVFPIQLARDHIASWSKSGDVVLDPFVGSGTTAVAAAELGRNYIGIDISVEYCELARKRVSEATE